MTKGGAIQAILNEIGELRQGDLTREEQISLIQADSILRLAEQVEALRMPVANVSSHVLGLHNRLDKLISALERRG